MPFLINTNFIISVAKSLNIQISDYKAMAISYFIKQKKRFVLTQDHIDYMKQIYLSVCEQLLNISMTMNKNIPKPISLIYIAMRQNETLKYKELREFLMTLPISASISKIRDIANGIFTTIATDDACGK